MHVGVLCVQHVSLDAPTLVMLELTSLYAPGTITSFNAVLIPSISYLILCKPRLSVCGRVLCQSTEQLCDRQAFSEQSLLPFPVFEVMRHHAAASTSGEHMSEVDRPATTAQCAMLPSAQCCQSR